MVGFTEDVPSSMIPKSKSWVQFSPATQFFATRIPPSLASVGPTDTATPEWEQLAPTAATHT
jgi:hypothetical protein